MISDRLNFIFDFISKIGCLCGSFAIKFDPENRKFLYCDIPKLRKRFLINALFYRFWLTTSVALTVKAFLDEDLNQCVLKLLFTICGVLVLIIQSIAVNHVEDIMILVNLNFGFLHDTQG